MAEVLMTGSDEARLDTDLKCSIALGRAYATRVPTPAKKPDGCAPCSWPECGCQHSPAPAAPVGMDWKLSEDARQTIAEIDRNIREAPANIASHSRSSAGSEPVAWRWKVSPMQLNWQYSEAPPATSPVYNLELLYRDPPQAVEVPVEAVRAAITLLARKITKLSWSRDDCRRKGQDVYVSNLTAQIDKLDEYYHALSALALSRPQSK